MLQKKCYQQETSARYHGSHIQRKGRRAFETTRAAKSNFSRSMSVGPPCSGVVVFVGITVLVSVGVRVGMTVSVGVEVRVGMTVRVVVRVAVVVLDDVMVRVLVLVEVEVAVVVCVGVGVSVEGSPMRGCVGGVTEAGKRAGLRAAP